LYVGAVFVACTRVEMADPRPIVSIDGGFGGEPQGGVGSVPGEGGNQGGGEGVERGGGPPSVDLGIWPTYAAGSTDAAVGAVLASIATLSVGASTLPLYERWSDLSGPTGSPRALTWSRLDAMIDPYRARSGDVALCVGLVDRQSPAWPATLDIDSQSAVEALQSTIDEIYARYAPQLSHLCFGYELDRFVEAAPERDADSLLTLLQGAVDYARAHPLKAPRTAVGTSITLAALTGEARAPLERLLLGDEAVVVYDALDADGALKEPEAVSEELTRAVEALASEAERPTPLALFEAGYPSDGAPGASERAQRDYYEALFEAVDRHRSELSFVGIYGLGDRAAPDCQTEAEAFGDADGVRPFVRCKMGLRADEDGVVAEKAAWAVISRAISRYR
jgi:hypothetical protein